MSGRESSRRSAFAPIHWVLPGDGTNGYISSWGPDLSGVPAESTRA